tara:strand:+ start:259 stop:627 length:369 start_codon:yes stop_codon:yes gene_type:complete
MSKRAIVGLGAGIVALGCLAGALSESDSVQVKNIEVNIVEPLDDLVNDASQRNNTHAYSRLDLNLGCGRTPVAHKRHKREFFEGTYNGGEAINGCYDNPANRALSGLGLGFIVLGLIGYRRR